MYIARHNRPVDLMAAQIPHTENEQMHKRTTVHSDWFHFSADPFSGIANTPDIFTISQIDKNV